uniref:AlNc14C19G1970 protein n=1 Tax=Albugo laibachii Nc14 TaxID=890382 RepID=F0W500_9STRA|nr:AlNc14C19G1970 [Albugo laibachii Nc14]|eukprot:CCA16190.1 AlNc14C19G1970 [Albugo laibachii Nc14]
MDEQEPARNWQNDQKIFVERIIKAHKIYKRANLNTNALPYLYRWSSHIFCTNWPEGLSLISQNCQRNLISELNFLKNDILSISKAARGEKWFLL